MSRFDELPVTLKTNFQAYCDLKNANILRIKSNQENFGQKSNQSFFSLIPEARRTALD